MIAWRTETFNQKIDHFSNYEMYSHLRKNADKAVNMLAVFGLEMVIAEDFIDRIIAMPLEYIQAWLDGANHLEWREQDLKRLKAIKGGYTDILEEYPEAEIHRICPSTAKFYRQCGFEILTRKAEAGSLERTFAIKTNASKGGQEYEKNVGPNRHGHSVGG